MQGPELRIGLGERLLRALGGCQGGVGGQSDVGVQLRVQTLDLRQNGLSHLNR